MKTLSKVGGALLVLLACQPALGAAKKKVAIPDVRTVGTFDPKTVQGLSMVVASEAEKFPLKVVAGTDLSALIGFEQQKQLMGCSDSSCLAEIGGALGVDYLLSTQVSEVGGVWLLSATLLDVAKSTALKRVSKKADRVHDLVDLTGQATIEALSAIPLPEGTAVKPEPAPQPTPKPQPQPQPQPKPEVTAAAQAGAPMSSQRIAGIALDAAGGAMLIGGGICGILANGKYNAAKSATDLTTFQDAKSAGKTQAMVADILYGVGAATAIAGVVLTIIGGSSGPAATPSAAVTLAPSPTGASLVLSGGF